MKLGCCVGMLSKSKERVGDEIIHLFEKLGYDYVELPLAQVMALSDEAFFEMNERLKSNKIPVEACNNFFPPSVRLTGGDASMEKILEYTRKATDRAAQMGVRVIVLGSAGAKNIPQGFPVEEAHKQFITALRGIQPIVEPLCITVVLEPLNKLESNFITTAQEGLDLMKEADCENIKLLIDYYHLRMENEPLDIVKEAGSDLRHVHIAAKEGRRFPSEKDGEGYGAFFDALKSISYSGRVSIEGFLGDVEVDGKASFDLLRRFL